MKTHRILAGIAGIVFAASLFRSAFINSSRDFNSGKSLSGFDCLLTSIRALFSFDSTDFSVYLAGFGFTNLAFPILVGMLFTSSTSILTIRRFFSLLAAGYALTWLLFMFQESITHDQKSPLGSGYYLWLASYILLFVAHVFTEKGPSQAPDKILKS